MTFRTALRVVCIGYLILLTFFLWAPDPTLHGVRSLVFIRTTAGAIVHFLAFLALGTLVFLSQWPLRKWVLFLGLLAYGVLTEYCQRFFPPRTPQVVSALQNLAGITAGLGACWLAASAWQWIREGGAGSRELTASGRESGIAREA
jgi:VanZ family protein